MRIGINTGEVIAHSIEEGIVTGEAVNIAARFQSLAAPGRVVVGERTHRDTRRGVHVRRPGRGDGEGRRSSAPRLRGRTARRFGPSRQAATTPFVGRDAEMDLVRLLYSRTVTEQPVRACHDRRAPGHRQEPPLARGGDGRSRRGGARVVRGRCLPYGDGLTYWPLAEILKKRRRDPRQRHIGDGPRQGPRARLDPRFPGDEGIGVTSILLSSIGVELDSDPLTGAEPRDGASDDRSSVAAVRRSRSPGMRPLVALIEDRALGRPEAARPRRGDRGARQRRDRSSCAWPVRSCSSGVQGGAAAWRTPPRSPCRRSRPATGRPLIEHLLDGQAPAEIVGPILRPFRGQPVLRGRAPPDDDRGRRRSPDEPAGGSSCGRSPRSSPTPSKASSRRGSTCWSPTRSERSRTRP